MVIALASHHCGTGLVPGHEAIHGLGLLFPLFSAPRGGLGLLFALFSAPMGFSPGSLDFPTKTNISKFQEDPDAGLP